MEKPTALAVKPAEDDCSQLCSSSPRKGISWDCFTVAQFGNSSKEDAQHHLWSRHQPASFAEHHRAKPPRTPPLTNHACAFFFPIKLLNKKQKRKQNISPTKCRKKPCVDEPAPKMSAISHVGWPWDLCSIAPTSHQRDSPWGCPWIRSILQVWEKTHLQPCNKPAHRSKPCSSAFENLMGKKNNFLWWMQGAVSSAPCHTEVPGNLLPPPGWACWACHEALPS